MLRYTRFMLQVGLRRCFCGVYLSVIVPCVVIVASYYVRQPLHKSSWPDLAVKVRQHLQDMHGEIQELFSHICASKLRVPPPWEQTQGDLNMPSCARMLDESLQGYYGNVMMVLVEAWHSKILSTVQYLAAQPEPLHAQLIELHADKMLAGAIFVQQLQASNGSPTRAALMIGIHRTPRHKTMRLRLQQTPSVVVTDAIVERVKAWCTARRMQHLYVCPYTELRGRLAAHGFGPAQPATSYRFSQLHIQHDICEESDLMVLELSRPWFAWLLEYRSTE